MNIEIGYGTHGSSLSVKWGISDRYSDSDVDVFLDRWQLDKAWWNNLRRAAYRTVDDRHEIEQAKAVLRKHGVM